MTNPTSNFGWQMPEPTDLVTNLPADFEVFGQAVDSDFVDLLGGTTGQVLSKTSNTDLDFTWVSDATGMTNPMTTTGDSIYSSSGSTPARLGIGSAGQVLTVASGLPSWATPASGGGMTVLASGSLSGAAVTISTINQTYNDLVLDISGAVWSANANVGIRVNAITTGYGYAYYGNSGNTATNQANGAGETYWIAGDGAVLPDASDTFKRYRFTFPMYALTTGTLQMFGFYSWGNENSTNSNAIIIASQETADNIDTIIFRTSGGQTFSAGTYTLYGVK